jgi:hypothetical protein
MAVQNLEADLSIGNINLFTCVNAEQEAHDDDKFTKLYLGYNQL